jgi:predicted nuclease with TOPRIM domain
MANTFQKQQKLRDANAKLESDLAADAASAKHKTTHFKAKINEHQAKTDELEQQLERNRAECAKLQMCIESQDSDASRVGHSLKEYTEYRDGMHCDLKTMTLWLQKAEEMMQVGTS